MKRLLLLGLLSVLLGPQSGRATDATYVNNGTITFPPQIDATNVVNNGIFDFTFVTNAVDGSFSDNTTDFPFETSNTQNYTNNGTMTGSVGFRFENAPSTGPRKMAASFRNRLAGVITALDGGRNATLIDGNFTINPLIIPSYLLISATNLHNEGNLIAGAGGLMRLTGKNVNLSRSGVQIQPIVPEGSFVVSTNYFSPDVAIYDKYWGQSNQVMNSRNIIQQGGAFVVSPRSLVNIAPDYPFFSIIGYRTIVLSNPVGDFYTNTLATTNIAITNATGEASTTNVASTNIVQAAFIGLPPAGNVAWGVRFFPSTDFLNPMQTVTAGLAVITTNAVTAGLEFSSLYLVDTLASETNRGFYTNFLSVQTSRPQNYRLQREAPFQFSAGSPGNADFNPDLLYQDDFASATVTNDYAAYSAFVDNIASRPPGIPAGTVTNLPGRIEILADNLDISKTRFRADGLLNIVTPHLINSSNAVVDCENLSYTLGSTNGNLKVQNLAQESVARMMGTNSVWSGVWTNYQNMIIESYVQDPDDTNSYIRADITNVVEFRIHAMLWDAQDMQTLVPVVVNKLVTHSTNVVVNDKMTVVQSFLTDGLSFTLNGGITFSNTYFTDTLGQTVVISLENWVGTNAPNLRFFTNNGNLRIPNEAHFGDDRPLPYTAFVNQGNITAAGQRINSDYAELGGDNVTSADFTLITRSGKVEGGTVTAGSDAVFYADVLKLGQAIIATASRLDLTVTNSLFDSGGGAGNAFACNDGFRLLIKPQTGDLLGTFVETIAPAFAEVDHEWAGADRGASAAGFLNNTALGTLLLTPGDLEAQFPPLFSFAGTGGNNGLYVDVLDLSQLLDYQTELEINPGLVIYYAAAKINFTPPPTNGVAQLPEEYLNGQFGGRLRWVQDFAGPGSSVATVSNGVSIMVNKALRNSLIIDSDGDGVPNKLDFLPFNNALVAQLGMVTPPLTAVLSWNATPQKIYEIQAATNYAAPVWQTVKYYTNTAATNGVVTTQIPVPAGTAQQFYRVGVVNP